MELYGRSELSQKECREKLGTLLSKILFMFQNDYKIKIILYLATVNEPVSIRKIARNIKISHKNVIKHLKALESEGIVEVVYSQSNLRLYRMVENLRPEIKVFIDCNSILTPIR